MNSIDDEWAEKLGVVRERLVRLAGDQGVDIVLDDSDQTLRIGSDDGVAFESIFQNIKDNESVIGVDGRGVSFPPYVREFDGGQKDTAFRDAWVSSVIDAANTSKIPMNMKIEDDQVSVFMYEEDVFVGFVNAEHMGVFEKMATARLES